MVKESSTIESLGEARHREDAVHRRLRRDLAHQRADLRRDLSARVVLIT